MFLNKKPFVKTEDLFKIDKIAREDCISNFKTNFMESSNSENDLNEFQQELSDLFKNFYESNNKNKKLLVKELKRNATENYQLEMKNVSFLKLKFFLFIKN